MATKRLGTLLVILAALSVASCGHSSADAPKARACTLALPAPHDSRLHADGTKLRDALGRVVVLRGVDAGGRSKFAPFMPFDYASPSGTDAFASALAAYMDRAASWGIDAMRVPFTWAAVEPLQGTYDEDFLKRYDALLDAAWARGISTVVDFHQDVYSEVFCGDGFPAWTVPDPKPAPHHDCPAWQLEYLQNKGVAAAFDRFWADASPVRAAFEQMWTMMVKRHKDRPGVVGFEPINEPGWGSEDIPTFEATTLSSFYAQEVATMRAAAPSSLVFVDPVGLDAFTITTGLVRPPGDGIVFAPHFYPLGTNPDNVAPGLQKWVDLATQWNVPTFVGEFGASHSPDTSADYMAAHFAAFDALGISGTEWEYSVATEAWNGEAYGIVAADGTEYPVATAVIRPFARAVAGESIASSFDATSRAFALAYTPSAGATHVSEVSLPARAYPSGFDVALTGGCFDASQSNRILVQADDAATSVELHITSR